MFAFAQAIPSYQRSPECTLALVLDQPPGSDSGCGLTIRSGDGLIMCGLSSGCDACGGSLTDPEMESALCSVVSDSIPLAASAEPGAGRVRSGESGQGGQFMSLIRWSQLAASRPDRSPRRAPAPVKNSLRQSCGFAVCPEPETRVNRAHCELSNSRDRDLKACCSRRLGSVSVAPRRGLSGSFPRATAGRMLRS